MAITTRNLREFDEFPAGLQLFQDSLNRFLSEPSARPWTPAVDIFETENEIVLKADVPDVSMEQLDIRLENGTLIIKGERKFNNESKQNGFHRIERGYGSFARSFSLPESIDAEKVQAGYDKGVLTVMLPKKEVAKPRSIKVQLNNN